VATEGDPISNRLIDVGCNGSQGAGRRNACGNRSLPGSNVDAAIAQVSPGMVRADGAILEIGTSLRSLSTPSLANWSRKGRTTGLTRSSISGLNATVSWFMTMNVRGARLLPRLLPARSLSKQASKFLAGGDSGSLMVEDVTSNLALLVCFIRQFLCCNTKPMTKSSIISPQPWWYCRAQVRSFMLLR